MTHLTKVGEMMSKRISIALVVASLLIGLSGFIYGLSRDLQPTPSRVLADPAGSADREPTPAAEASPIQYDYLLQKVAPLTGTTIEVNWGDMGQKLIEAGAIDLEKFETHYNGLNEEQESALLGDELTAITFKPENIQFWTNMLWALGLTQESKVLDEGPMKQNEAQTPIGYYASTGGWTLGSTSATELYNSARLLELTPEQDDLVYRVAENVFRPCCGNHTAYPDCNHGMAVLGLLELLTAQGATEEKLYEAALVFNAYAFSDSYISMAAFFTLQGIDWAHVSAKDALGPAYSGIQGARRIAAAVGPIPGAPSPGGSCAA
jgi:hypothetical protein